MECNSSGPILKYSNFCLEDLPKCTKEIRSVGIQNLSDTPRVLTAASQYSLFDHFLLALNGIEMEWKTSLLHCSTPSLLRNEMTLGFSVFLEYCAALLGVRCQTSWDRVVVPS